jgi:uncharacterized protein
MEVRLAHASAVIVQHVPAAARDRFLQWQRDISQIAERFPGYSSTDIYPPSDAAHDEWVIVQYFDDPDSLQNWLNAPVRKHWIDKIQHEMGKARETDIHGGFSEWFNERAQDQADPAGWKMALAVLLGLYPTVMLLTLYFPGPYLIGWGMALSMFIGNALSVSILQWGVMPVLNKLLGPWLQAERRQSPRLFYGGIVLILATLAILCAAFRVLAN